MWKYLCTWRFGQHLALSHHCWWWPPGIWLVVLTGSAGQSHLGKQATWNPRWKQSSGKCYLHHHHLPSFEDWCLPFMYRKRTTQAHVAALYSQQIATEVLALGFEKKLNISPNYLHSSSPTTTISAKGKPDMVMHMAWPHIFWTWSNFPGKILNDSDGTGSDGPITSQPGRNS